MYKRKSHKPIFSYLFVPNSKMFSSKFIALHNLNLKIPKMIHCYKPKMRAAKNRTQITALSFSMGKSADSALFYQFS